MPVYEFEVYELYASKIRVTADNRAEAFIKIQDGDGHHVGEPEYIESIDHKQLSDLDDEFPGIIEELNSAGCEVEDTDMTNVRSIEEAV